MLKTRYPSEVPSDTQAAVEPFFQPGDVYQHLGDHAPEIFDIELLESMYPNHGRPGYHPLLLLLMLILQMLEGIPDRQAARMAVVRMDWKYALRQSLTWDGLHYSDLCNFRKRLQAHERGPELLEQVVAYLVKQGFIKSKSKQRTDATHMLGLVEDLSRLELVWESLRLTLKGVVTVDAAWLSNHVPTQVVERYKVRQSDYHLSREEAQVELAAAGTDATWLVEQIAQMGTADIQALPIVDLLRTVIMQQFEPLANDADDEQNADVDDDTDSDGHSSSTAVAPHEDTANRTEDGADTDPRAMMMHRVPRSNKAAAGNVILSPHEPDAQFSQKRQTKWDGFKVQVSETVEDDGPSFITDIAVTSAIQADNIALAAIQDRLISRDLKPDTHYVDQGYCCGHTIAESQARGIDLRGRVTHSSNKVAGYRLEDFEIDLENRIARCPQGHLATSFNPSASKDVAYHVRFGKQCADCPVREHCTTEARGRSLAIGPYHDILMARRREMQTDEFRQEMHQRAAIEGTISELVRGYGLRHARYRSLVKVNLQAILTAIAANLNRLMRYQADLARKALFSIADSIDLLCNPNQYHTLCPTFSTESTGKGTTLVGEAFP